MKNKAGFVNIIYMSVVALIAVMVLISSYSRLINVAKGRSKFADRIPEEYRAESELNGYLAQYYQGKIDSLDDNFEKSENLDNAIIETTFDSSGQQNTITVSLQKGLSSSVYKMYFASPGTLQAETDTIIAFDCTPSMNVQEINGQTRLQNLKSNLVDLIGQLSLRQLNIGLLVYGEQVEWVASPDERLPQDELLARIEQSIGETTQESSVCGVGETSSPGGAMAYINSYLLSRNNNKVAILLINGEPESVIQHGGKCLSEEECILCKQKALDYLSCNLADVNTKWDRYSKGNRDPLVRLYTIYVDSSIPGLELNESLRKYSDVSNFVNSYDSLGSILVDILSAIESSSYRVTIEKVIDL